MKGWIRSLSVAAAFFVWAGCGQAAGQDASVRKPAADFQLNDLNGNPIRLSGLKGKVVLLDFWATWCPPCRAELPHFKELYAQYQGKGLEVIGVSLDQGGEPGVRDFLKRNGIPYPVVMGGENLAKLYGGIRGIPTTFLIDKQGRIVKQYVGYQDKKVFEDQIQLLLAE